MDDKMANLGNSYMVVATLITTITFAAGITVPGSYETNSGQAEPKGAPILLKDAAFKAFLVTNTVSFVFSLAAIFACIVAYQEASVYRRSKAIERIYGVGGFLILVALVAVSVAFVTASYSILAHSQAMAVIVTVLGLIYFPLVLYILFLFVNADIDPSEVLQLGNDPL